MGSHAKVKRNYIIEAFNSTFRYLDNLLNIDYSYFEQMVHRIYSAELQLNKANSSDTEAIFVGFNFARASSHVSDFNSCNIITAKLL